MKGLRIISMLAACLLLSSCAARKAPPTTTSENNQSSQTADATIEDTLANAPVHLRMTFAGDCTLGMYNEDPDEAGIRFPKVYESAGSLTYPFDRVKHLFARDDLTVINFEGTLTEAAQAARKAYVFKGAPAYAKILPASSIEAATLANNHTWDYLEQGFLDTKAYLEAADVGLLYENTPYIIEIQGASVVLIADNTAFIESFTEGEVAARVLHQIKAHKREDNITIVNIHWGTERHIAPSAWQQKIARMWIDAGADLIVGHHPHVLQGIEQYDGKYIVYSLGNFAFGGISTAQPKETALLHVTVLAAKNAPPQIDIAVTPCYTTSSQLYFRGMLRNNYQPMPLEGAQAEGVVSLLLQRSALLKNGVRKINMYA